MKQISIIAHVRKAGVAGLFPALTDWLGAKGIGIRLVPEEARALRVPQLGVADETLFAGSDLVIVLGGDGTMLRAARLMKGLQIPVLGINMGKLGFLMQVGHESLYEALEQVIGGELLVEQRMMIAAEVTYANGVKSDYLALNEFLAGSHTFSRLARLDVFLNGQLFNRFAVDGLIIATPTGSTAYSLSAGGPFVAPELDLLLVTPICPHSLFNRTVVLGPEDVVTIKLTEAKRHKMRFSYDGVATNDEVKEIVVRRAPERFNFVATGGPGYYATLRKRLGNWDF